MGMMALKHKELYHDDLLETRLNVHSSFLSSISITTPSSLLCIDYTGQLIDTLDIA